MGFRLGRFFGLKDSHILKMTYTREERRRNIINNIAASLVVGVFFGVLYDTGSWWAAIFVTLLYGVFAFWVS